VTPLLIFLVYVHFFLDSTNGRLSYTSFKLDFTDRIVLMKKGDDVEYLAEDMECMMVIRGKEDG
jgi:hypothetical protein